MLKVRGIHKKYSGKQNKRALKGINFQIQTGEHAFVIGETGSGKSTLFKCIYGTEFPDKGSIRWKGVLQKHQGQLIAGFSQMKLVEQDFNIKMYNTVRGVIEAALPIGLTKTEIKRQSDELIHLFELKSSASKKVLELSGGQQQRVALAQAFANLPELLLLDEPFAHLDPQLKNNIFLHLKRKMDEENLSVLTITHDYNETLKHADKVLILEKGKLIQQGEPQEVYAKPINTYTAGLLGEFNRINYRGVDLVFRPEEMQFNSSGAHAGEIKAKRFCGHYYEMDVRWNGSNLLAYVPQSTAYEIGDQVNFDIGNEIQISEE